MDINSEVYIWVTSAEPMDGGFLREGLSFDGEYGLGGEDVQETGPIDLIFSEWDLDVGKAKIL